MRLETARLWLYPMTAGQLRQAERDLPGVARSFGARAEPFGFWEMWQKRRIYKAKRSWLARYPDAWLITTAWLIVRKSDHQMMGEAGFKGPPQEQRSIEIGYSTREPYRGQGIMTEAAGALCGFAFAQKQYKIDLVTALTRKDNLASHRVLEKNGFVRMPSEGKYWRWEKRQGETR